jgi:hypothetical protein
VLGDRRVEADAGDAAEEPLADAAQVDARHRAGDRRRKGALRVERIAELARQVVAGAERDRRQRRLAARQPLRRPVPGAVAAADEEPLDALLDRAARTRGEVGGAGALFEGDAVRGGEGAQLLAVTRAASPAGGGIEQQAGAHGRRDPRSIALTATERRDPTPVDSSDAAARAADSGLRQ